MVCGGLRLGNWGHGHADLLHWLWWSPETVAITLPALFTYKCHWVHLVSEVSALLLLPLLSWSSSASPAPWIPTLTSIPVLRFLAWPCDWEWAVKACGRACHTLGHHHMGKWVRELAATGCLGGKNLSCIHDAVKSLTRPARTPQLSAKTVIGWYQTCFGPEPKKTFVGWALTVLLSVICPFLCLQAGGQVTLIAIGAYKGRLLSVSGTGPGKLHWFSLATGRY